VKYLVLLLALLPGCPFKDGVDVDEDEPTKEEIAVRVEEAEATIKLYEARLGSTKSQIRQDILNRDYLLTRAWKLYELQKTGAVAQNEYLAAKLAYDLAELEVIESRGEVEEAEQDLALAKIRKKMAEKGDKSYSIKVDRIRVRRNRAK
jgi:hypothetical protein